MSDDDSRDDNLSAAAWFARVRALERRGEFLRAYDVATRGLAEHPADLTLRYRAVLVLARAGATRLAEQRYLEYGLSAHSDEDIAALGARLAKDAALTEQGARRAELARVGADRYDAIFQRTGGYFPGINAATMRLVSGALEPARDIALQILKGLDDPGAAIGGDAYYRNATAAEAALILGDSAAARRYLGEALAAHGGDLAALASTRRQLRLVCEVTGVDVRVLDGFSPPKVIHYCGHMLATPGAHGHLRIEAEGALADMISVHLERERVGFGYGSLGAGADIIFAEALLARGAELHVVLPFQRDEFVEVSVRVGGDRWVPRFERCLAAARSVRFATTDDFLGDEQLFGYCSELAMGACVLHARYLDAPVEQLAVWNGVAPTSSWGTAFDVMAWHALHLPQTIFGDGVAQPMFVGQPLVPAQEREGRVRRAMLFGDVKGFSKLSDRELPRFVTGVLGCLAQVIDTFATRVSYRNTWGDGLFLVFDDAREAAQCALALQRAMFALDVARLELPTHLALRLGGHFGPVYRTQDPILKTENYIGAHVSRAARIEPVTPEGSVYVTEPFAAMLALDPEQQFACDYVGHQAAAKHYGDIPMYLLRQRHIS